VLASLLPSLVLMVLATRREGGGTRVALLASVTMLCLAPLHDYFYIRGLTSVDDFYWMQYAAPIALIVFAWAQLDRLVGALGAVEGHAEKLERKVAERTRELELANAAKTRFSLPPATTCVSRWSVSACSPTCCATPGCRRRCTECSTASAIRCRR